MPLFDTEYEVDRDPTHMSFEAIFDSGESLLISPHLCGNHDPGGRSEGHPDHRELIDCTIITRVPTINPLGFLGVEPLVVEIIAPVSWTISLDMASAMIEGLSEVAPWAKLNSETDLEAYNPENNPRIEVDPITPDPEEE